MDIVKRNFILFFRNEILSLFFICGFFIPIWIIIVKSSLIDAEQSKDLEMDSTKNRVLVSALLISPFLSWRKNYVGAENITTIELLSSILKSFKTYFINTPHINNIIQ